MKVFSVGAFAAGVIVVAAAHAAPVNRYYDVASHKWVELGPGGPGGRSMANPIPRQVVDYVGPYTANTIVVSTSERRLYYVLGDGKAIKYGVGVGREGFTWSGTNRISRKEEWPGWTPPPAMRKRRPNLPAPYGRRAEQPARRARACISALRFTESTARTSPGRSARQSPPAASAWQTRTSSTSTSR